LKNSHLRLSLLLIAAAALPSAARGMNIDKTLTIQVYDVCAGDGTNCAPKGPTGDDFYAAEVNRIWAQAGISVLFNFAGDIWNSDFLDIDDTVDGRGFEDLTAAYGTHGPSDTTVDLFLVHTITSAYGVAWLGDGGMAQAMDSILSYPNPAGLGRIDTFAHELGHNLGNVENGAPESDGDGHSTNPMELMAGGGIRNVPSTMADIYPSGSGWDQLSAYQIDLSRQSSLLSDIDVPEPVSLGLAALGFLIVGMALRRRRA
jgi:hypothetical protein